MLSYWLPPALYALSSFGLWGLFTKLAVDRIDTNSALVYQTLGVVLVGLVSLYFVNFRPATDFKGISFGVLTGVAYALGCLFYFVAASRGKITTVVSLTALYPLVTLVLSFFLLKEAITLKQGVGIALSLVAILLMST